MSGAEGFDLGRLGKPGFGARREAILSGLEGGDWVLSARTPRIKKQCTVCPRLVRRGQEAKIGGIRLGNLHRWHVRREVQKDGSSLFFAGGSRILMKKREKPRDRMARWFDPLRLGEPGVGDSDPGQGLNRRGALVARLQARRRLSG